MRFMSLIIFGLLFNVSGQAEEIYPRVEPLLGFFSTSTGLHLQVESGGCTDAGSFEVSKHFYRKTIQLFFIRAVPDTCLARLQDGLFVTYNFEQLGLKVGDRFQIMNQIQIRSVPEQP